MKKVGKIFHLDLNNEQSKVQIISLLEEGKSKLILGQYVVIFTKKNPETKYLAVIKDYTPDIDYHRHKEATITSIKNDMELDENYKENVESIISSANLLGIISEKNEFKYYSNVREFPKITDLDVYIPDAKFLEKLFLSAVLTNDNEKEKAIFEIGKMRYGTLPSYTDLYSDKESVNINFDATNLLRKRTAIFGKSGYGKSNTVKTVIGMMTAKHPDCGQLIIDTNGEYALDNDQNGGLIDIFHEAGLKNKISLYTGKKIHEEKLEKYGKKTFNSLSFDVFENISPSIDIILSNFGAEDNLPMYLEAWKNATSGEDDQSKLFSNQKSSQNKAIIWSIWFRCCLDAGLTPQNEKAISSPSLGLKESFLVELANHHFPLEDDESYTDWSEVMGDKRDELISEYQLFNGKNKNKFLTKSIETMALYADYYIQDKDKVEKNKKEGAITLSSGSSIKGFMELSKYTRRLYQLKPFNSGELDVKGEKSISLGEKIWDDLKEKKVVILDVASIPIGVAKSLNKQILGYLLKRASSEFGDYTKIKEFKNFDALIYIEEAQNYLSKDQTGSGSVYERIAKEGRKFHLGLVYITQQPSAIDEKITSQTENIIAMHMSNKNDVNTLNRIKDKFDELTCKFLKDEAQKGLGYIYSEPHQPFVLPCQIHLFSKDLIIKNLKK